MVSSHDVFRWVDKNDTTGIPNGAITGGCSPDGKLIYVIRAYHDTRLVAGNHEEGNAFAEYHYFGPKNSTKWQYLVSNEEVSGMTALFSNNDIWCNATVKAITSDYFSPMMIISRGSSAEMNVIEESQFHAHFFPITSDKDIHTCVNATWGHKQLQAIFTSSTLTPKQQLSVEVILMNVDDCNSPAWTWYVESRCIPGFYTECSRIQITRVAEFTRCAINCNCFDSCHFLYLKYNRLPLKTQTSEQLCEIVAPHNGRN